MAELTPKERLQPSLLDRLTDNEPDKQQEAREKRVLSMRKLRESVQRDLAWLLNSGNLETVQDLDDYPLVSHSVINYGLPDLAGRGWSACCAKRSGTSSRAFCATRSRSVPWSPATR
jgi:type VI secretion system protein ImpF